MSDKEDFDAINEILADHREFDLFVKLPDGFRGNTSVNDVEDRQDNRRSGLEWVIALARVEFGAMVAGFTAHPDPYQWVQPESIAYNATLQLLLEGVEGHYMALQDPAKTDTQLKELYEDNRVKVALAKARRIRIARMMIQVLGRVELATYTDRQADQLGSVQRDLDHQQTEMRRIIRAFLSCLLYTSPSPRDQRGARMPASA